ncbi:MAG: FAD:protein FMN transferase [Isosphaeraceae bacterium]
MMGTEIRVFVGGRHDPGLPEPDAVLAVIEEQLAEFERRLSRFRPESELSRFNRDEREEVPTSALLREGVRAGIWAADRTGGLVDPTLLAPLEAAGYATSRSGSQSAPLADALAAAPARRPARPDPRAAWRSIRVLDDVGTIRRPPGVRFDTGGIGKGLAADLVAQRLEGYGRYAIDCGGDVRVGGRDPGTDPVEIEVRHPVTGAAADAFTIWRGAVATSGIDARLWLRSDGRHAHHLIDPATGEPAWTGLIAATARAATALEADTLAKAGLLSGPEGARRFLSEHGGLIVCDDGRVERIGPLLDPPRIRVSLPGRAPGPAVGNKP